MSKFQTFMDSSYTIWGEVILPNNENVTVVPTSLLCGAGLLATDRQMQW